MALPTTYRSDTHGPKTTNLTIRVSGIARCGSCGTFYARGAIHRGTSACWASEAWAANHGVGK